MDYLKAKKIMAFLLACGVEADFEDESEVRIDVYDGSHNFLFFINYEEEWEALKDIIQKIAPRLGEMSC